MPRIILWKRVLLEIDECLRGRGWLRGGDGDRHNNRLIVLDPLDVTAGLYRRQPPQSFRPHPSRKNHTQQRHCVFKDPRQLVRRQGEEEPKMNDVKAPLITLWERFVDIMALEFDVVRQPRRGRKELIRDVEANDLRRQRGIFSDIDGPDPNQIKC